MNPATIALEDRSCGTCTLCCRLPDIDALEKPANQWCIHCQEAKGCSIYADRPDLCRDFLCFWRTDARLASVWDPAVSKMMVYGQGTQFTVLVDPDHPGIWRQEPYHTQLKDWAAAFKQAGGYVIVFCGDDVFKV